ncbi:DDHD domain protein [Talaromyces stipitatus ATCC 10500]|uniref:DDHD domain protein n=1 Tax=Talaromyces stipitatus (strain ATCC 10500 / CBS 375.48 / QM 6759 / NRRL 1006) TaxID=441959 RepID=B8M0Y7_TALSN|nr:DDHD domain protein [Talaromyces stipitatus ATCC 10500]EED21767.1 DDHD domain protein [Talaromyces stipitatus ATCC 10500]
MPATDPKPSFLESISPWSTTRSSTPQNGPDNASDTVDSLKQGTGQDHVTSYKKRLSSLRYPPDCPPLQTRWFYAVDTPKSKPSFTGMEKPEPLKPLPPAKKFIPFYTKDSQSIERAFQQLLQQEAVDSTEKTKDNESKQSTVKVPVNEDYLYDVDVDKRELGPAYWLGPIYEVRRGTWFFQEGSVLRPCEENLATQLEEGYLKMKPWQPQYSQNKPTTGTATISDEKSQANQPSKDSSPVRGVTSKKTSDEGRPERDRSDSPSRSGVPSQSLPVYRLFGSYMNSTVTYQDSTVAWLNYDDFMSRVSSTVYQRFGGVGGTKVVRGYVEQGTQKDSVDTKAGPSKSSSSVAPAMHSGVTGKENPPPNQDDSTGSTEPEGLNSKALSTGHRITLQRQMSSLNGEAGDSAELEEEARKQEEQEMEDSRETEGEERDREIDHLILVTHGIGQRLGLRLDSINFISDVTTLRKTMKSVYAASPDLQALNSQYPDAKKNCRVQVLPVCWRYLLDFPRQGLRQNRKELDLADPDSLSSEEEQYPNLADITLEGVPAVRNLISDLAMDVLLYQSGYREHIMGIVQRECNRILQLFKSRNPSFKGSVSLCGHSLGSAIMFDILCRQSQRSHRDFEEKGKRQSSKQNRARESMTGYPLDFDCKEFFCLGSPLALFQMLQAKTIAGRSLANGSAERNSALSHSLGAATPPIGDPTEQAVFELNPSVSSPQCEELYNIFHPSDPVSYRLEPLITPAMTALKPQPLPFVKKNIWTASGQSLSNISSRVGSLWTNFTTGVASSLLNRSLGIQSDGTSGSTHSRTASQQSSSSDTKNDKFQSGSKVLDHELEFPTLIDSGMETLYEGFQKARRSDKKGGSGDSSDDVEDRSRRIKIEESKVRALNSNGRVDYSIQE